MARLSDAALALAEAGWRVFPVDAVSKRPRTPHGHLDATTDPAIIKGWRRLFDHEGGIATPTGNGLFVVDVDVRHGGSIPDWCPPTRKVKTQHGGWHLHYRLLGGDIISKPSLFGIGVDSKSAGGYVLIPPSPGYEWVDQRPRTALLKPMVESHIMPGVLTPSGGIARLGPDKWHRGVIHEQVLAWAAYFAGQMDDDDEVTAAVWNLVQQARKAGITIDNAGDHIGSAIRWVLRREAESASTIPEQVPPVS